MKENDDIFGDVEVWAKQGRAKDRPVSESEEEREERRAEESKRAVDEMKRIVELSQSQFTRSTYLCEWCKPSDYPSIHPERCKVLLCPKHGMVWHYPKRGDEKCTTQKRDQER